MSNEFQINRDVVVLAEGVANARTACGRETQPVKFIELHFVDLLVSASPDGDSENGLQDEAAALTTEDDGNRSNEDEEFENATDSADVALPPQVNRPAGVQRNAHYA